MAHVGLHEMLAPLGGEVRAELVRRLGLADAGDVVVLALDREERGVADGGRVDPFAPVHHRAPRQGVLDEHGLDGLQVELRRQVHHGEILVVEVAVLLGGVAIILDQMLEEFVMGRDMPVEVHRHEPAQLQEARIDPAQEARLRPRHLHDDAPLEPVDRLGLGEFVHGGGVDARVDRAAHQRHGGGKARRAPRLHQRHRRQHRHGRLADGHHVRVRAQMVEHGDDVVDIVVEIEEPLGERDHARIDPVGDVDVGMRQHGLDRAAQQRGVVARHGRDDQELAPSCDLTLGIHALEALEGAERTAPDGALADGMGLAVDPGLGDPELGLGIAARRALEQFGGGGDRARQRRPGERVDGVAPRELGGVGHGAERRQRGVVHLVHEVVHGGRLASLGVARRVGASLYPLAAKLAGEG